MSGGQNRRYTITFEVKSTEKGATAIGKTIKVIGWEAIKRPRGWVGPGGHYSTPDSRPRSELKTGSEVRFYLLEGVRQFDIVPAQRVRESSKGNFRQRHLPWRTCSPSLSGAESSVG